MIDLILSIFLLIGFVRGFFKGFLMELAGLVALIAGIIGAMYFSEYMYSFLQSFISWEEQYLELLAYALTFIIIVALVSIIGSILTKAANFIALGCVNRILGAVFGLVKMAFFASILFMVLRQTEAMDIQQETKDTSILYTPVSRLAPMILPNVVRELKSRDLFDKPVEPSSAVQNNEGN